MKKLLHLMGLVAFLALLPAAHAADASGKWTGAFDFQGSNVPLTFHFAIADGALSGTVEGLPTTPAVIHEGKVDNGSLTFWVNTDYEGQTYKLIFKGTVSAAGDQIAFSLATDDGSWGTQMTAAKSTDTAPSTGDVTGTWKGNFDAQGTSMTLTLHLTSSAGTVTGTAEGLPTTPTDIHDGKLDGDAVTFWLNTDYQGQKYKLVFKGTVSAEQIVFSFGVDDGSWGTQMTATKQAM
jgi:hypothetical protein